MKRIFACVLAVALVSSVNAQPPAMKPSPEHDLLKKYVGTWEMTAKMQGQEMKGTSVYSMEMGGLWLSSTVTMDMFGTKFEGRGLDSYDAGKKKYVAVWVDSMVTTPMVLEGEFDAKTKTLTMTGMGVGPDGKPSKHTLTSKWIDDDNFVFGMMQGDEKEPSFVINYKRKK